MYACVCVEVRVQPCHIAQLQEALGPLACL